MHCGSGWASRPKEQDQRRISCFSPIYSMLRLIEAESGQVLRYDCGITDQFNSTVTYASMAFFKRLLSRIVAA